MNLLSIDKASLAGWVDRFVDVPILICGDVMLDRYVFGSVDRISPEAPVPVLKRERELAVLGGAGNVLRNLTALKTRSSLVSVVGDDAGGREIRSLIRGSGSTDEYVFTDSRRPTTIKVRYLAAGHQLLRVDHEDNTPISHDQAKLVAKSLAAAISSTRSVILSDYGKGLLTSQTITELVALAGEAKVPVIIDPKHHDFRIYAGATVITPNRRELKDATGMPTQTDQEVESACHRIIERCNIENVLVTRSEQGMSLVTRKDVQHLPAEAKEVFDVSGAGDTVVALVGAGLAIGLTLNHAAVIANAAAGIVVGKVGTAIVRPAELKSSLNDDSKVDPESKILDLEMTIEQTRAWSRQGLTVGFTNGCFDLLHAGHLSLLQRARAMCDRLVVAINSDQSVKRLKGRSRPVQSEQARARLLASLIHVDVVLIFDDDTPIEVIKALRPNVLIKGSDYTNKQVVGADIVEQAGGRVYLLDLLDGYSTTGIVNQLRLAPS